MHGTILVFSTDGEMTRTDLDREPELEEIKAGIGGGYLEKVPGFDSIRIGPDIYDCVALCDEDGKRQQMPVNVEATARWHDALKANGHPGLFDSAGRAVDLLVGPIVVLVGDDEFMEGL